MIIKRIILGIFLLSFNLADYLGGYSGSGFRYSTNARDMSLGNSLTSEYNHGFNAFSNPALLSKIRKLEIGISYFPMTLDRYIQVFSVSQSLSESAGASISFFNSGTSAIEGKDFYNQSTGMFGANEGYVMFSFGSSVNQNISFGLSVKAIFNNIDTYSGKGISGDIGVLYDLSDKIGLSLFINDVFGKYSWEGLSASSASFEETLPMISSFSIRYDIKNNISLFSKIDYMKPNQLNLFRLRSGLELNRNNYVLRFGIIQDKGIGHNESLDFKYLLGAGTNITVLGGQVIKLDYCLDFGKENEGISNLFSISFVR